MSDEFTNTILAPFRSVDTEIDPLADDMGSVEQRLASLEAAQVLLHGGFVEQSLRLDRIGLRLERIERRLDLVDAP